MVSSLLAQTATPPTLGASNVAASKLPPPLPPAKSPVDFFRDLLAMSPAERRQALTNRPPESQKRILAKVREYESMRPNQRDLRLRLTELHFYLFPLMKTSPAARAAQLADVPEDDRKLVEERLQEWDKLSPATQKELLENYAIIRYLVGGAEPPKPGAMEDISPALRDKLQAGIRQWQALSEDQRQALLTRFNRFFDLTAAEKDRTLKTLSEAERKQIEKTLNSFSKLPRAARDQCLVSFQKFASLSLEERQQFLKSAERWRLMSPDQRQAWKDLVEKLPPVPPNIELPPRLLPTPARPRSGMPVVTNHN